MNFFFRLSFWGYLFFGMGVLLFIDLFYPIKISFWILFCAVVLISLGIQLLMIPKNAKSWHLGSDFQHIKKNLSPDKTEENIMFGKSILDYTNIKKNGSYTAGRHIYYFCSRDSSNQSSRSYSD